MSSQVNQSDAAESMWLNGLSLSERVASLRRTVAVETETGIDKERAAKRFQRWQSQAPFTKGDYLSQRLKMAQLSEEEFMNLLAEPVESLSYRVPGKPDWLVKVEAAYASGDSALQASEERTDSRPRIEFQQASFLIGLEPLIRQGVAQLQKGIGSLQLKYAVLPFEVGKVVELLLAGLPQQLMGLTARTMVLELNVARMQGLLDGETPEERFLSFIERMRQRDVMLDLLKEYPVLARQLVIRVENWVRYSLEFLEHLCADWPEICATLTPGSDPGQLSQVSTGAGDTHRGGRSVVITSFSNGFKLVYKPHSLKVDVHFGELLQWLNERGSHAPFRTLKVIEGSGYGWVEFVEPQACSRPEQLQRFYQRQGGYLALLYVLEATDFHLENLIAAAEHPMLIDLEALFHPRFKAIFSEREDGLYVAEIMSHSVLRTGLLPHRVWSDADSEGVELSGLGGAPGQLSPKGSPVFAAIGTDEMHVVRQRMEMRGANNRPTLNESEVDVHEYVEAIIDGFTAIYCLLLEHREGLRAVDGPLARFAQDEVRVVARATRTYALLLNESYHPDLLRSGLDRDRLFDKLWIEVEHRPDLEKILAAEAADLWREDIPMFSTHPNSRDIWTSENERIADFFEDSSMNAVRKRLEKLDEDDLARQVWFIRASMTALTLGKGQNTWKRHELAERPAPIEREELLKAARAVGDRLDLLAIRERDNACWIGLTMMNERTWNVLPLGTDLYGGSLGIAFFLAYLGATTGEERYTALARRALKPLQERVRMNLSQDGGAVSGATSIGLFGGLGGVIYGFTHLGKLWCEAALIDEAEALVDHISPLIAQDEALDIIAGAAGCIGALSSLYHCTKSKSALAAAIDCANVLIARAQPMATGIAWMTRLKSSRPLAGFSHGTAGMAWALLKVAALAGEQRFHRAAIDAIAYERSVFVPEVGNWPDFRILDGSQEGQEKGEPKFMTAWCHGAPGIGLARLAALEHLADEQTHSEIYIALKTTLKHGFGFNHSLCHGDFGNLELLLQASQKLGDPEWQQRVEHVAGSVVQSIRERGWLCGVPHHVETEGLLTGLAGIGYGLLRLAAPGTVPSLLCVEPPPTAN